MVEKGSTKFQIMEAALNLFSVQGFEATSVSQIANAVGIRKASLYSHFESKQAILDALVSDVMEQYDARSIFVRQPQATHPLSADEAVAMIQGQMLYILHDPYISKARKMLMIEQFQNSELAKMQTKQNYFDV